MNNVSPALASTVTAILAGLAAPAAASPVHGDVEIDPTAYALDGNSIHAGIARDHLRLDLGNFGLEVPGFVHGDDRFDVAFDGYGAKLQWFRRADQGGWFGGVGAGLSRTRVHLRGTDMVATDRQVSTSVEAGYRFLLPADLYVTAWLGVGYQWSADDVTVGGETFEATPLTVFPAVHLGYRFR